MDRTGLKKPPVAPKPKVIAPSQPDLHPFARQKSFEQEDLKKNAVKPIIAPKPLLPKISSEPKPLASKGAPQTFFQEKSEIQGPEALPKSKNGAHLEHKKPDWLTEGKCHGYLPDEKSRRPIQHGKHDKTDPNNRPQKITNPGPKIPTKPQRKTAMNKGLAPESVQDSTTDQSRHGQNLIKPKVLTGSERLATRKHQNSAGSVQIHPPSVPGSIFKNPEPKEQLLDKNQHVHTPTEENDKSTPTLTSFRPVPPLAQNKPHKNYVMVPVRMDGTAEVIADKAMMKGQKNLESRNPSKPPKPYNNTAKDSYQKTLENKQKAYDEKVPTIDVGSARTVLSRGQLECKDNQKLSVTQETNYPLEGAEAKRPDTDLNLKTELHIPENMDANRSFKTNSKLIHHLDFKKELKECNIDRNQNEPLKLAPENRTNLASVQETEAEFLCPPQVSKQSDEYVLPGAESVHHYEYMAAYPASKGMQSQKQRQLSNVDEDVYENLEKLEEIPDSTDQKYTESSEHEELSSEDEEIQDSNSEEEEDNSSNSIKEESQNDARSTKRSHIAREIMSSEKVFVDVLKLLHIGFRDAVAKASCQAGKTLIEERVLNQILFYLPQLFELNCDLLRELEERVAHWNEHSGVADIFVNKGPFLKMYTAYICEFDKNVALLEEQCRKNPAFAKVVREFERSPCCANLAIKHYMLKPIQRIPQYQLLLTDYLKHLDESSPDFKQTQAALEIVKEVANHANETMKKGDNFQKLIQVQCRLLGNHELVQPGRALLKEGTMMKLSRKVMQPRMFFLFNDMLLYTTPLQSGQYKLNNALSLAGMKVTKPIHEGYQNELNIESVERSFILSASSPAIRDSWLEAISNAIEDYTKKKISFNQSKSPEEVDRDCVDSMYQLGSKAPIWIPDPRVTMCMICTSEFTLTWRRHHCRACGKVVCSTCSANKHPLEYKKNQLARVCDECFQILQNNSSGPVSPHAKSAKRKQLKKTADALKFPANTKESSMSGYLERINPKKKQWKRFWFVIKDKVLYTFAACEDLRAMESLPLLGFYLQEDQSGPSLQFWLYHKNTLYFGFKTDDAHIYQRWVDAFREAVIL